MKYTFFILLSLALFSCDKVEFPYEKQVSSDLDSTLYPNAWATYPYPVFTANSNTIRNILIEDYTGHTCVFCPAAADLAEQLEDTYPDRVLVASIHSSPGGMGEFQAVEAAPSEFTYDFTNPVGLQYGLTFQNGFGFVGNPRGTLNRITFAGEMFQKAGQWTQKVSDIIAANDLKVNLQAKINYYDQTRGLFLHSEIDPKTVDISEINLVAYFIEDSLISPQKRQTGSVTEVVTDYVHRNIHRANLDDQAFGRTLSSKYLRSDGLYQVNMSFKIPDQYNAQNCHVLVYAMNKNTYEIYQVVKVDIP